MVYYFLSPDESSGACGLLAQLVEHIVHIDGVTGSSPVQTTIIKPCKCLHGFSFSRKVFEFTSMEVFSAACGGFSFCIPSLFLFHLHIFRHYMSPGRLREAFFGLSCAICPPQSPDFLFSLFPLYKTAVKFLGLTVVFLYSPSSSALISMTLPPSFS